MRKEIKEAWGKVYEYLGEEHSGLKKKEQGKALEEGVHLAFLMSVDEVGLSGISER